MVGRDRYHHLAAGTGRHTHHVYTRLLWQGLSRAALRAAREGEGASMPEYEFHGRETVDVMEGKDGITIIAELFGVYAEDLLMNLEGDSLIIAAGQFRKNIALPRPAKSIVMKSFKNGILELKLD
ncbi:MAG: Hsp20/alpha crystallin family protein [Methanothrix sp.]|nr:Hsp20/alpha crystallin family protein [Methanothrix sp.]